jgi:hypothetical protein
MNDKKEEILDEAIRAETNMSKLYEVYQERFSEDAEFWGKLAEEEKDHASIINMARDVLSEEVLSQVFSYGDLDRLKEVNEQVEGLIEEYGTKAPSKEEAYDIAIELEEKAFELFYQKKMTWEPNSNEMDVLQKLNKDSKDHAARIKKLRLEGR